jgi:aldose 1-epimerase
MFRSKRYSLILTVCGTLVTLHMRSLAAEAKREAFGALTDGRPIEAVVLSNSAGMSVRIMTLGAAIQALSVPDRHGISEDVVLGFDSAQQYVGDTHYFGATVGRYANRIKEGRFTLDGVDYRLATNDHGNHLHGGSKGFDKVLWSIDSVTSGSPATVVLSYLSPDGEEGYPGALHVTASYSLDDNNTLHLEYQARTDRPTIVNISAHSYFNLSGGAANGTALNDLVQIHASRYTPIDDKLIPTGELRNVAGSAFDFRTPTSVGLRVRDGREQQLRFGRGYDHNFALENSIDKLRVAVKVEDPDSGRVLEILTRAPGLQFYSGNFLDATVAGKSGRLYRQGDALVFEPQLFPDAPNRTSFASARLNPGETYSNTIVYRFSVSKPDARR